MTWYKSLGYTELLFILFFVVAYLLYIRRSISIAKAFQTSRFKVFLKMSLRLLYFALIVLSLLGPSFGVMQKEVQSVGKDIFLLVDLSNSMNAYDVPPSRIDRVKFELKNIVKSFASDRIGLIIFGSDAFVQCPLTFDQSAINLFVETLNTGLIPYGGTDFYPPLKMAVQKLMDNEKDAISDDQSKIIILISDGEDFGDEMTDVAKEIRSSGIKVFTLGVGTDRGSKIPARRGFKKDKKGQDVVSALNRKAMKKLASITNGKYFEINKNKNEIPRLINAVSAIKGKMNASKKIDSAANKYSYLLAIALVLVVLDVLITVKTVPRI